MREPPQRKGRSCIRPEISRTFTFGQKGVSSGQFYSSHLGQIILNKEFVQFTKLDLNYLTKENYDPFFFSLVQNATLIQDINKILQPNNLLSPHSDVKILYHDFPNFASYAQLFGLMNDEKAGIPRTAYYGVVIFYYRDLRVFLVPQSFSKSF